LDKETGRCEEVALLNPECIGQSDKTAVITGDERIAEFEPEHATLLIETLTFTAGRLMFIIVSLPLISAIP
jgi:hypothetical protein